MKDIKTKEDIKKDLTNSLNKYKELVAKWERVTRVYKKDNTDFKNVTRCFKNVNVTEKTYSLKSYKEYQLTVYGSGYNKDSIDFIQLVRYCNIKPDEKRIINEPYLEPYFELNADEMEKMIKDRIVLFKGYIQEYETLLNNVDFYCNIIDPLVNQLNNIVKDTKKYNLKDKYSNSLTYDLEAYVKNNIKTW